MRSVPLLLLGLTLAAAPALAVNVAPSAGAVESPRVEVYESSTDGVSFRLEVPEIAVEQLSLDGNEFQLLSIPGGDLEGKSGEPGIPNLTRLVAIPDDVAVRVTAVAEEEEELTGYRLLPVQPESGTGLAYDGSAYARKGYKSQPLVVAGEPARCGAMRVVPLTFHPIDYDPARGAVKVTRRMRVEVTFGGQDPTAARRRDHATISPSFDRLYGSVVVNYSELPRGVVLPGTYLIICYDNAGVVSRLQPLVEWRNRTGSPVLLATTAVTGTTNTAIKAYIQGIYDSANPPLEYVLLVGDVDRIPTWHETLSGYGGEGDHPYTLLDGSDPLSDVHIGRLSYSYSNPDELTLIVNKILGYEKTPEMTDTSWFLRAGLTGDPTYSGQSVVIANQWVKIRLRELGYTEIDTIFGGDFVSGMFETLDQGETLFGYRGYVNMSGWSNSLCYQLGNGWKMPFVVALTCGTGSFASGTSISEAFLRAGTGTTEPAAAIGAIATATLGTHTRYNNCIYGGIFYGVIYDELWQMGAAFTRGKLEMYLNYIQREPEEVTIWSHWNNLMGDPAVPIWTAVPRTLTVTHPATVSVGTNSVSVTVEGLLGPVGDAQVCIWKGSETYAVGYTNAQGEVELPVDMTTTGLAFVTVTKHNCRPYLATFTVSTGLSLVGYLESSVDDDATGTSSGNGDGLPNPGETIELPVRLKNFGATGATDVSATLTSADPYVTILDGVETFGSIPAGGMAWSADDFDIAIDSSCPDGHAARFGLDVTSGVNEWHSLIDLEVVSAELNNVGFTLYNLGPNGIFDPGETVQLSVRLRNDGGANASNVSATLTSVNPYVSVVDAAASYGTILMGGAVENTVDRFEISAASDTYEGYLAMFELVTQFSGGRLDTTDVGVVVGNRTADDPTGPDSYGYLAYDNTDAAYPERPVYAWVEIDPNYGGTGTDVGLNDTGGYADDVVTVNIPFPFRYYGQSYTRATICSNGWIAMGSTYLTAYRNWTIPGAQGPEAMIAPFWDNLYQQSAEVYQKYDAVNHRWIVEWSRFKNDYSGSTETFEVIFLDPAHHPTQTGDGEIIFQYETVANNDALDNYATVGIERKGQAEGLLYSYSNYYSAGAATLQAGRAIRFVPTVAGVTGTLRGTVRNASYGDAPVAGVEIEVMEAARSFLTGSDGTYGGSVIAGTYTVTAQHPSFDPDTVYDVVILEGEVTQRDFSLTDIAGPAITTTPHPPTSDQVGPYVIPVTIVEFSGLDEATLYYRTNYGEFTGVPLTALGGNEYEGEIPGQIWGTYVEYYVYARDGLGYESTDPAGAPAQLYGFPVSEEVVVLDDDFEANHGWSVGAGDDNATSGIWVRAEPVGTEQGGFPVQPDTDHTADPGQLCYVTANGAEGGAAGDADVDNGKTTLFSPVFDLSPYSNATVRYWVWYTNNRGSNPDSDTWGVQVSDDGSSWVDLENTTSSTNAWVEREFNLEEHTSLTDEVQLRFVARDEGGGSLVEAAIDDFSLVAVNAVVAVPTVGAPRAYALHRGRPNPFNPSTVIAFEMMDRAKVTLRVYDVAGRIVATLIDGVVPAGRHELRWDGRTSGSRSAASGTYFVRMEAPGFMEVRQLTLVR
jgi:hypothetical protein